MKKIRNQIARQIAVKGFRWSKFSGREIMIKNNAIFEIRKFLNLHLDGVGFLGGWRVGQTCPYGFE